MKQKLNQEIEYRQANLSDLKWLIGVRKETMFDYLRLSGSSVSHEELKKRVLHQFASTKIIKFENKDIGMIKVLRKDTSWELIQIQISKNYQNLGIGKKVISELLKEARKKRKRVILSVLKQNPAIKLYSKLGFSKFSEDSVSYKMAIDFSQTE